MLIPKSELIPNKTIQICGSKSISNRLLILKALYGNIEITNNSDAQDTELLQAALVSDAHMIDIHHAGTAMRFLCAYFAAQEAREVVLTGSERMRQRPIKYLVEALKSLGAEIHYTENDGFPPLKIIGKKLEKNRVEISAHISSQYITALMLIGAKFENGLEIELQGDITSRPYIEMTQELLNQVGIVSSFVGNLIRIEGFKSKSVYQKTAIEVESDWSSASYYYSIAAIGRKPISIGNFRKQSLQGDSRLVSIYEDFFGVNSIFDELTQQILLEPDLSILPKNIVIDMNDCPDIAQTLCVTASALQIPFKITGLATLKVKETDRLLALKTELHKLGCKTEITEDTIQSVAFFEPKEDISITTYNDHRMAMSFAAFALIKKINIENEEVVEKSYPEFWRDFQSVTRSV